MEAIKREVEALVEQMHLPDEVVSLREVKKALTF